MMCPTKEFRSGPRLNSKWKEGRKKERKNERKKERKKERLNSKWKKGRNEKIWINVKDKNLD